MALYGSLCMHGYVGMMYVFMAMYVLPCMHCNVCIAICVLICMHDYVSACMHGYVCLHTYTYVYIHIDRA